MSGQTIQSMKLYVQVERIFNELEAAGFDRNAPLRVADLSPFDHYHYNGTQAVEAAIAALGLSAASHVAEVGAGIGGPARYIADRTGCLVTAIELQPNLHAVANELTGRCGLSDRVAHVCSDVLDAPLEPGSYDAMVSWLALFHVADQAALFAKIAGALRPGGQLFAEDLCSRGPFTAEERTLLDGPLYSRGMQTLDSYAAQLAAAGFTDIRIEDMSDDWAGFTRERADDFARQRARNLRVHGAAVADGLEEFYGMMAGLFEGGNLGGVRVLARKAS